MSVLDDLIKQFGVKEKVVKSKAKTVDELIESSFQDQITIMNGGKIETGKDKNGNPKYKKSWRKDNGEVSITIGVLPLFKQDDQPIVFPSVSEGDYKKLVTSLYDKYKSGDLSNEVNDLKKRKEAADKANAESRQREAEAKKMKKAME